MRAVPDCGIERSRNIDTSERANFVGDGQTLRYELEICFTLVQIGIEQIDPAADLGDHEVTLREGSRDGTNACGIVQIHLRAISRAIAKLLMGCCEFIRIFRLHEDGSTQSEGTGEARVRCCLCNHGSRVEQSCPNDSSGSLFHE